MGWIVMHDVPVNEQAIAKGATHTGVWRRVRGAEAFNVWYYMTSAGAASITISFRVTLFPPGLGGTHDPDSTDRNNYRDIQIATGQTTKDEWVKLTVPAELKLPFYAYKAVVVEADVAAVTTLSVAVNHNSVGA